MGKKAMQQTTSQFQKNLSKKSNILDKKPIEKEELLETAVAKNIPHKGAIHPWSRWWASPGEEYLRYSPQYQESRFPNGQKWCWLIQSNKSVATSCCQDLELDGSLQSC